ncbi:MAG: MxaS protein [Glaciimonas sp.]|nr:MxaS protein [Glaciimonas sp.]
MNTTSEFHYRLPMAAGGFRPGAHPGLSFGTGQEFATHMRLFDNPDPRRIDLRASLLNVRREWLVRLYRQRVAVPVHAIVDVSASMTFGAHRPKLHVVADFAESLGRSAFRAGDPAGLMAFDSDERDDLYLPVRHSRGVGSMMGDLLRKCADADAEAGQRTATHGLALQRTVERLAGKTGLVFLVSDFHWPLDGLAATLDILAQAFVVPVVVWDPAEIEPPKDDGLLAIRDAESGAHRTLWVNRKMRDQWRDRVAQRRTDIDATFAGRGMRPFYLHTTFDPEALSRYFLEGLG